MKRLQLSLLATVATFGLVACGSNNGGSELPPARDTVDVFVLSGQSNMEGSTYWQHPNGTPLLENYFEEEGMDFEPISNGLDNVLTSYYGFYYPRGVSDAHSSSEDQSSPEGKMQPNFLPTTVGMGVGDAPQGKSGIFFGPELGLANTIAEYADEDYPVHLIKCAFSGSGFEKMDGATWKSREEDPSKSLFYLLKTYTQSCLDAIEEEGFTPVLRGFLWHQGESDTGNANYETQMRQLIKDFKDEFVSYAIDEDEDNIAFIDCTIYDGSKRTYGANPGCNAAKWAIANESEDDLNFCIDGSFNTENGLKLEIGDDAKGGYNTYHYNTPDAYRLGEAYGNIILDNDLMEY